SLKDPYICGPPSCAESDKFRYLPETIYYYEYKVNVETYFAGSSNNRSTLDIKAEAAIQFIKPCEGLLQLRDVTLLDQDENYPVERAENVEYVVRGQEDTSLILVKTRDLSQCRNRVDHNIYKQVNCRERHLFEPFSGRNSGAMTTVIQDLVLRLDSGPVGQTGARLPRPALSGAGTAAGKGSHHLPQSLVSITNWCAPAAACPIRRWNSCWQGLPPSATEPREYYKLVRACRGLPYPALEQLLARAPTICHRASITNWCAPAAACPIRRWNSCWQGLPPSATEPREYYNWCAPAAACPIRRWNSCWQGLPPSATEPREYYKLVRACRGLPYPALEQLLARAPTICHRASKHMLDALPYIASAGSVELIKDMILKGAVDPQEGNADKYAGTPEEAAERPAGQLHRVVHGAFVLQAQREIVIAIKALGNIGGFKQEFADILMNIIGDSLVPVPIRLREHRSAPGVLPASDEVSHSQHHQENIPLLATFVWSHLNNLGQSSLPSRVEIQGLLSGNPMPQLEDSGNYEANVIFTPDSYIPRSVSLNLTVDIKTKINDKLEALRFIRSLSDADQVKEKVDDIGYKNEALKHQYPMAELGIKVFGNEISYWNAEGHSEILKSLERMNPQMRILEILSGKEISYNKASLFLDTTFSVPTGCGLPLNMNLMGTSYVNTKMSGTMVDKFSQSGNLDFEGKIHPSTSGTRLNLRLYTATAVEAKLNIRGLGLVRLDLSLPKLQQQGLNQNRIEQNTCSWSTFDKGIGIKVCASYQVRCA
ncbi:LOW QUALITY PROTEIN: hypothetical protein MSG28_012727, partial [Choristoneura fumiferana]